MAATLASVLPDHCLEEFSIPTPSGSTVAGYSRGLIKDAISAKSPIAVLVHGYPETNFMYVDIQQTHDHQQDILLTLHENVTGGVMYVLDSFDVILQMFMTDQTIRLLPSTVPLFIPDVPGYGASTPSQTAHDKGTIGQAILFALAEYLKQKGLSAPYPIIFTGHDRGGRIVHRLAVDALTYTEQFDVLGVAMLDIVPTIVQWEGMQRPAEAAGFFHWPFLANVDLATQILMTVGGDVFLQMMFDRWRGALTPKGTENFYADGALDVYKTSFKQESVIRASNLDYEAGAKQDVIQQQKDQAEGRKLTIPSLALYSASGIGKRFDVPGTWKDWVAKESLLTAQGVGEGAGHFFAEENPEETVEKLLAWYRTVGAYQ